MFKIAEDKKNKDTPGATQEQLHLSAEEFLNIAIEENNVVENTDITFDGDNENQMTQAINTYVYSSQIYNATGTNDYILTQAQGNENLLPVKFDRNIILKFKIPNTNTSETCTLAIQDSSLAAKPLVDAYGDPIAIEILAVDGLVTILWNPTLDKWQVVDNTQDIVNLNSLVLNTAKGLLFSVNSGKITSGLADFLSIANNKQINVLAGGGNPDLIMSYTSAEKVVETANQIIDITQNGSYYLTRNPAGYTPIPFSLSLIGNIIIGQNKIYSPANFLTQGTATRTNGSPTLSAVAGIDWTHIAIGNLLSGLGMAISLAATVDRANGSNILTNVILTGAEWAKLKIGQRITGGGIPANNFITGFDENAQTITMQIAATSNGTSFTATISITPKITAFNQGASTITLDTNAISTGAAGVIQIYEEADLSLFKIGMPTTGTGIPASSAITDIDIPNKTITINNNATANTDLLAITTTQTGIYEQNTIPATPIDGELFVQKNPLKTQKYISSAWTDFDFARLGEVIKSSGVIGTPVKYTFNGLTFLNPPFPIGVNLDYQYSTNIGSENISYQLLAKCITAEFGYIAGQIVNVGSVLTQNGTVIMNPSVRITRNTITVRASASGYGSLNINAGVNVAFTPANWDYFVVCQRNF